MEKGINITVTKTEPQPHEKWDCEGCGKGVYLNEPHTVVVNDEEDISELYCLDCLAKQKASPEDATGLTIHLEEYHITITL